MRREELYLTDIIEAADAIQRFLKNVEKDAFLKNEVIQSAVLQKLSIIGEAASRLRPACAIMRFAVAHGRARPQSGLAPARAAG